MEKRLSILRVNFLFLGLGIGLVGWVAGRFERTLSGAWYPAALVISGITLVVIGFVFPLRSRLHRISALGFSILTVATLIYGVSNLLPTARMILEQKALREMVDDPLLDHRGMPNASGNDANGFRNDGVPNPMDIVAIGDSQTWGSNADRYQTWPAALAQVSNRSVYNAAYGGYGAVQYRTLAQELVSSQPRLMIIGLYFGNDLFDAYNMVYNRDVYADLRGDSADTVLLDDSIVSQVSGLTRGISQTRTDFYRAHYFGPLANLMLTVDWSYDADYAWAEANPENGAVYDQNGLRTVFTTTYRYLALDLNDPRIAEGLRITQTMLTDIQNMADEAGVQLVVALIPTKESVFANMMGSGDSDYRQLIDMESEVRRRIKAGMDAEQIAYVDSLNALQVATEQGRQLYPTNSDGHPNANGYAVIAQTIAKYIGAQ